MRFPRIFAITVALLASLAASAQTPYTVGPYPCGPASEPLQCHDFPVLLNGVAVGTGWLHVYLVNSGPEYIIWGGGMSHVPEAIIDSSQCKQTQVFTSGTLHATECVSLDVTYHGGIPGDVDYYTGSGTFHFTYLYSRGGGGRGGGGAGWRRSLTDGSVVFVNY
jgi:hypothetical protein